MELVGLIEPLETVNDRFRYLRISNNLTLKEVGKSMNKTDKQINFMELGKRGIHAEDVCDYSRVFNVSPNWLLTGRE